MTLNEYEKVKNYTYTEYVDYLKKKYGEAKYDYMTPSFNKNNKVSRTKEGLYCHHIKEYQAIMLGNKLYAERNPYEWQKAHNLVYCNLLEHMLLHILICEEHMPKSKEELILLVSNLEIVGIGGITNFFIPELNDFYSGWESGLPWQQRCHEEIKNSKDVYFELIKRVKKLKGYPTFNTGDIYGTQAGTLVKDWDKLNNLKLYEELERL